MSQIHKVIILNKPLKIRGFTPIQWILLVVALGSAFLVGTKIPQSWKIGNLPAGFIVGLLIFCGAMVGVNASEMKPMRWWLNLFLYRLELVPKTYISHLEECEEYPDPSIEEEPKYSDEGYLDIG